MKNDCDIGIIGAGPSGAVAACLLRAHGYRVTLLERQRFPRFVIGESLLPQSLQTLAKARCLDAVEQHGFQRKTGATFKRDQYYADIVFDEKFSTGPGYAYHVQRAEFDQLLADCAAEQGAQVCYEHTVTAVQAQLNNCRIDYLDDQQQPQSLHCRFILDASGYGRVLPRLLGIDKPSNLPPRASLFTHVQDHLAENSPHRRQTTLITVHPTQPDVWFWLISFSDGRSSVGAVGNADYLQPFQQQGLDGLKALIAEDKPLAEILAAADFDTPATAINGYSGSVSDFYGDGFAVLGNAGEFLDPVFSSGVTAALYSAELAAEAVHCTLSGQAVDWQADYVQPLLGGIEVFRHYVQAWYDGSLQRVIFSEGKNPQVTAMIAAILAGYAWDRKNPFVKDVKRLNSVVQLCE